MQTNVTTSPRVGGFGTTALLLLLGTALVLAVFAICFNHLRPTIETDIKSRVTRALDGTGITAEHIDVSGLDVTLNGDIDSAVLADEASKITASVAGVNQVFNNLAVAPATDSSQSDATAQSAANDDQLSEPAAQSTSDLVIEPVETDPVLAPATLEITSNADKFNVQGIVPDSATAERIYDAIAGKFGKDNIEDEMSVFEKSAEPRWISGAIALIDQLDNIDNPSIKITSDTAVVGGYVSSETLGQQKEALANRLLGEFLTVKSELTVGKPDQPNSAQPDPVVEKLPPAFKLARRGDVLIINGNLSSEDEKSLALRRITNLFGSVGLNDEITVDDAVSEADWLSGLLDTISDLQDIDNLGVSVNSDQIILSGDVRDEDESSNLTAEVRRIVGADLSVVNNFTIADDSPTIANELEEIARLNTDLESLDLSSIRFERGSTQLTEDARAVLDQVAVVLAKYERQIIEIAGHTDSSGDAFRNLELSKQRADAVREYLIEQNIPAKRLRSIGYGETKPIGDNATAEGRAKNRRIEFNL